MMVVVMRVIMIVMIMVVDAFFLLAADEHARVIADHAAFYAFFQRNNRVRQPDCIHLFNEGLRRVQKRSERAHQHIARSAHAAIQINRSHMFTRFKNIVIIPASY